MPPLDGDSGIDIGGEGITGFTNTCAIGGDIDNEQEVTRSMHHWVVGVRVGLFPILTINSLNFLRIALHASAVDRPVEDVLPDSVKIDLLTFLGFPCEDFEIGPSPSYNNNFLNFSSSHLISSVISTIPKGNDPNMPEFGWLIIAGNGLPKIFSKWGFKILFEIKSGNDIFPPEL